MLMERPSSRRRITRQQHENQEPPGVLSLAQPGSTADTNGQKVANDGEPSSAKPWHRARSQLLAILAVLVLLTIVLWILRQPDIPNSPSKFTDIAESHRPDSSSPWPGILELHPEAHVFRAQTTIKLNWTVTAEYRRPDGVRKRIYLINGLFPGPTIEARSGDRLIISVRNDLQDEGVSIHWHGLHMKGSNSMDGTTGVTQCAIAPGKSFDYDFTIPESQSGTYWYHAHSSLQRADGLYGGLVIHRPASKAIRGIKSRNSASDILKYSYRKEILLLVGDWYHRPADKVLKWYLRAGSYGNEPVPDSLLINGAGHFDCSNAVPARPVDCSKNGYLIPHILIDSTDSYRVRVVNTGSLAGISLAFSHGYLDLIQVDGGLDVKQLKPPKRPNSKSIGVLYPGQRVDFILRHPKKAREKSSLTVELDPECFKYPNPALTGLQAFPVSKSFSNDTLIQSFPEPLNLPLKDHIDLGEISSTSNILSALPLHADKTYVVYTKISQMSRNQNIPLGHFNHTSWRPQANPPLPLITLDRSKWDSNQFSISTGNKPVWVDLVVNNLDEGAHPFHLHGHIFAVLTLHASTRGWGSYNPFDPQQRQQYQPTGNDLSKAVFRDTVLIPRRGHAVLRFRADNPGLWLFHCHILWHLAGGMAMVVDVMGESGSGSALDKGMGDEMEMCQYF
ncbi:hypothetical protein FQN55_000238 [Onygenales sp. PD_40]|nr:hypothetical protein FQN55_000238 [Onygenales sp. PD_40]